ncbi:MAG: hypothetical protein J3K34DRAFT_411131 [Monoraphidium minutum]|nr:MAG: hypothetical protein J3K34DRAFT_411131 [Monoraphidium minutum]
MRRALLLLALLACAAPMRGASAQGALAALGAVINTPAVVASTASAAASGAAALADFGGLTTNVGDLLTTFGVGKLPALGAVHGTLRSLTLNIIRSE